MQWLNDNQGFLAVIGILIPVFLALLAFKNQKKTKQLGYVVVSNKLVVPTQIASKLKVTFNRALVRSASVVIIRIVNTGNLPVLKEDFDSPISLLLPGADEVKTALSTRARPSDLNPQVEIQANQVLIKPTLINSGDMIELQLLVSGLASKVEMTGRIKGTRLLARKDLPYPPGSGPEGELLGFDKFMWYFFLPVPLTMLGGYMVATSKLDIFVKFTVIGLILLFDFVLNPMYVKRLIKRRALWA